MQVTLEQFSFFSKGLASANAASVGTVERFHSFLRTNPAWKHHIDSYLAIEDKDRQSQAKKSLPAVSVSVEITNETGKRAGLSDGEFVHTNLIQADFDDPTDPDSTIKQLQSDPHTRLIFRSASRKAKAFFRVNPVTTGHEHNTAWLALAAYCEAQGYGEIDPLPKAVNALCFISHDPDAILKDATPLPWSPLPEPPPPEPQIEFEDEPDLKALDFIPNDCDYETWRTVGMAIKAAGFGVEVFEKWTGGGRQRSTGEWTKEDIQANWNRYKGEGITWGSVVHLARENGWAPQPSGKRPNLVLAPEPMTPPTEGWQSQQSEIKQAFGSEHDTILIKADAGVGKDYAKASYIVQSDADVERYTEMVTRVGLGDEKVKDFNRLQESNQDRRAVYQWRSVFYNHDDSREFHIRMTMIGEELMCVQPGKFDVLRQKGITPQVSLCPTCPVQSECMDKGYLSQLRVASQSDYFITAQDGFLFDKSVSGFAEKIVKSERTTIGIVDEVKAHELFNFAELSKPELQQMGESWDGTPAGEFAIDLIQALEIGTMPNLTKVREIVMGLSESDCRMIVEAFTKHRIYGHALFGTLDKIFDDGLMIASGTFYPKHFSSKVAIATSKEALATLTEKGINAVFRQEISTNVLMLSYQQAIRFGFYEIPEGEDIRTIKEMPKLYANPQWTPLHQLQSLFEQYPRINDTPIVYDGLEIVFCLPPEVHPSIDKIIMMSATAETEIIRDKVFPDRDVQVIESEPAKWMPGSQVFQIRTGKYPRASVLDNEGNLKDFGIRAWDAMIAEMERTTDKNHVLITYQCLEDKPLPVGTVVGHYGAVEGENDKYADADVFWILFDPRVPPYEVCMRAKTIYGRDDDELVYDYDSEVSAYTDPRLQAIADSHATGELIQAIGRARLVRREGVQVVIITGRELPGISGREETTLFDLDDLITAGGLSNLKAQVHHREVDEKELPQTVKTMIEDGASDRKICAILGIHARLAKEIRSTLPSRARARTFREGMSLSAPSTIRVLIAGGAHVPNSIIGLVGAGTDTTKDILSALQQEHGIDTEAGKKRLQRMVRSGELIRSGRGRYALPDAGSDFLPEGL